MFNLLPENEIHYWEFLLLKAKGQYLAGLQLLLTVACQGKAPWLPYGPSVLAWLAAEYLARKAGAEKPRDGRSGSVQVNTGPGKQKLHYLASRFQRKQPWPLKTFHVQVHPHLPRHMSAVKINSCLVGLGQDLPMNLQSHRRTTTSLVSMASPYPSSLFCQKNTYNHSSRHTAARTLL
jgi:hypothetical protein